jgi:hypothetical protein
MITSSQKKPVKVTAIEPSSPQASIAPRAPDLIAFHATPAPKKGQQPILTPIGAAIAHDDGEGFTLQLNLMPTTGGRILLRMPTAKKTSKASTE